MYLINFIQYEMQKARLARVYGVYMLSAHIQRTTRNMQHRRSKSFMERFENHLQFTCLQSLVNSSADKLYN